MIHTGGASSRPIAGPMFVENLKDIYYAERKILVALPKMAKAANSDQLRAAFEKHGQALHQEI